jgi:hypothetical protein
MSHLYGKKRRCGERDPGGWGEGLFLAGFLPSIGVKEKLFLDIMRSWGLNMRKGNRNLFGRLGLIRDRGKTTVDLSAARQDESSWVRQFFRAGSMTGCKKELLLMNGAG